VGDTYDIAIGSGAKKIQELKVEESKRVRLADRSGQRTEESRIATLGMTAAGETKGCQKNADKGTLERTGVTGQIW
jgi:hypothetical protein